ncbi:ZFY26 protein, partial [Anhinga anhinga]|nr:ZFY26 protein [Anhinga anhinga]
DYELCEEWGHLYPVPREDLINLHREHLLHLLEMGDMEKALQVISRLSLTSIGQIKTQIWRCIILIYAFFLVSQVLLTLPELSRVNYFHLSSRPLLMLEQLLMNMKVDWVAVAVQTLHQLLAGQEIGFTVEDIDNLLSKYAEKALNFPFALKEKRS